jgi:transposase
MLDMSKETNLGFLRESNKVLQEKILLLQKEILLLKRETAIDKEISDSLSEELLLLRAKFFDKIGERRGSKETNKKTKAELPLPYNQNPLGDVPGPGIVLTTLDEIHRLVDLICKFCSSNNIKLMKDCYEESIEVVVEEKKYIIKKHLREKWTCLDCGKITTAAGAIKLIPGGKFSIQLAVAVVDDKFANHLPLDRQRKIMSQAGLYVDVKTLFTLTDHVGKLLSTIPAMIRDEILAQSYTCIDESPMNIFLKAGKKKGYIWSISNNYGSYYQYETTRSGDVAKEMLKGYKGPVMADAYGGYNFLYFIPEIIMALCWSHVRRKFFDAALTAPIAGEMVKLIDDLYDVEHEAKSFEDLKILRETKSSKIVEEIEKWAKEKEGTCLKNSSLGKALFYINRGLTPFTSKNKIVNENHIGSLKEFLKNPHIPIDNNMAERAQRDPVMGRKNFNGFQSYDGADIAMTFYTIIGTCKKLGIVPRVYLLEMALRAAQGNDLITPFQYGKLIQESNRGA